MALYVIEVNEFVISIIDGYIKTKADLLAEKAEVESGPQVPVSDDFKKFIDAEIQKVRAGAEHIVGAAIFNTLVAERLLEKEMEANKNTETENHA